MPHEPDRQFRAAEGTLPPATARRPKWGSRARTALAVACWVYAAVVLGCWIALRIAGAANWPAHLLLYGPRWLAAAPWPLLAAGAIWLRRPVLAVALALSLGALAGLTGFNVPAPALQRTAAPAQPRLRLLTCNVQRRDLRTERLAKLIRESRPAVVLLQECPQSAVAPLLGPDGWYVRSEGEFTVASRFPIRDFEALTHPDAPRRIVAVRACIDWFGRTIPIVTVHLMTPRAGLEEVLDGPRAGFARIAEILAVQERESRLARSWTKGLGESVVAAGDFNLTREHPLFRRDWSALGNAYSAVGFGLGHTMFTRRMGLRIDHVLYARDWQAEGCRVALDVGSAHRPVLADLAWQGPAAGP